MLHFPCDSFRKCKLSLSQFFIRFYQVIRYGQHCTLRQMHLILSYLAAQVLILNSGRSGIFTNAQIHEYRKRERLDTEEGISWCIFAEIFGGQIMSDILWTVRWKYNTMWNIDRAHKGEWSLNQIFYYDRCNWNIQGSWPKNVWHTRISTMCSETTRGTSNWIICQAYKVQNYILS